MHVRRLQRHAGQGLFCQGQQLRRVQGQLAADHLLGHFFDQCQQFLAPRALKPRQKAAQLPVSRFERGTGLIE